MTKFRARTTRAGLPLDESPGDEHPRAIPLTATDGNGTGPAYACPILDPLWSDEQIQHALQGLAAQ